MVSQTWYQGLPRYIQPSASQYRHLLITQIPTRGNMYVTVVEVCVPLVHIAVPISMEQVQY